MWFDEIEVELFKKGGEENFGNCEGEVGIKNPNFSRTAFMTDPKGNNKNSPKKQFVKKKRFQGP